MSTPLRVVQWATGNIGTRTMRAVIDHPGLELVGLHVHSADKVGRDAGDLCGRPPTGVLAVGDLDTVLALGADCVLYTPARCDFDEVAALLASGANVVTTRGEFHHPASMEPDRRIQIEAACVAGDASIYSTGSSPGFISEAVPLVLLSMQRRFDSLVIDEFADMSSRNSPEMLFKLMGFGADPAGFDPARFSHMAHAFGPSLRALAEGVGRTVDAVEASGEVAVASNDVTIAAGTVAAGTIAAQRPIVTALSEGEMLMQFRANWFVTTDLDPAWELRSTGWRVQVAGDTPLDVSIGFPVEPADYPDVSPNFTAHPTVNAVATVCAAPAGIRTTFDLPRVIPALG